MYSDSELDQAVAAGALQAGEVERLRAFQASRRSTPAIDEEEFRLVTSFNDIFVTLAIVIALFAVGSLGALVAPIVGAAAVAGVAWPLSMLFIARRRMALPSIVLLAAFVVGIGIAIASIGGGPLGACAAAVAAWWHWRHFHVPITVSYGTGALVVLWLSLVGNGRTAFGHGQQTLAAMLVAGIAVFAVAMWWDRSDPARLTRRSDVAFWLHLQAASLIVHPLFWMTGLARGSTSVGGAVTVLAVYLILGLVALAIDRRAILVSALAYVLFALGSLLFKVGDLSLAIPLSALTIGSALLLLSALWHQARRLLVRRLPPIWQSWLPDLDRSASPAPAA